MSHNSSYTVDSTTISRVPEALILRFMKNNLGKRRESNLMQKQTVYSTCSSSTASAVGEASVGSSATTGSTAVAAVALLATTVSLTRRRFAPPDRDDVASTKQSCHKRTHINRKYNVLYGFFQRRTHRFPRTPPLPLPRWATAVACNV